MIKVSFDNSQILWRTQNTVKHLRWSIFTVIINGFQPFTTCAKNSIVTARLSSKHVSVIINLIFTSASQLYSKITKNNEIFILLFFSEISPETQKQPVFIFRRPSLTARKDKFKPIESPKQTFWLVPNVANGQKRLWRYPQPYNLVPRAFF